MPTFCVWMTSHLLRKRNFNRWKLVCPALFLKTYEGKCLTLFFNKNTLPLISATSSNSQGSPMNNSNRSILSSNAKNFAFQESRDNHMGNFRVPQACATRPVQPQFARPTSTMGNGLQRDHHGTAGNRVGPSFTGGSGEGKRIETKLPPVQGERKFAMNFPQTVVSNDNRLYPQPARNKDSQRTSEQQLKNENSRHKATRTQMSDKQHREKNYVSSNDRGLPPQRHDPYDMPPSQLLDSEYLIYSL